MCRAGSSQGGQYLVKEIKDRKNVQLVFVWNRTITSLIEHVDKELILEDLTRFKQFSVDLIVEVAHPDITRQYGPQFLSHADYMIGSPTALADPQLEAILREAAIDHGLYVPSGAFWGGEDIKKMADRGTLKALKITMTKHPNSFKLCGDIKAKNAAVTDKAVVLYDGPVRSLCPLAPNNVNTMAAASLAAHNLGFDGVQGSIVADPNLPDWHIVEVEVWGPGDKESGKAFHCKTVRRNPALIGNVTGSATYASFLSSMLNACNKGPGVHLC
ncbi:putative L-aspartate dehydrogenase isoform X2 [Gigantopelta aegis]|uniref:putative L-aspartate dehydrogenase isoform X2 n=1 Tax=Gigantopelta aegis TaxID=1735272 RepID=UPI001B88CA64|nr:putative L-aspartate dehydrogenase isoform X2 [Gigantopelta aegis]